MQIHGNCRNLLSREGPCIDVSSCDVAAVEEEAPGRISVTRDAN